MNRKILLLCAWMVFALGCSKKGDPVPTPTPSPPVAPPVSPPAAYIPDNSFKIVAYFPSYRDPEAVDPGKYKMITHLNYAFLNPNADGSLAALSMPSRFSTVISRARAAGVKTAISVSGTSSIFVAMAANATARTKFVTNVVNFAVNYNLDGVDMDWEYPSTSNGSADTFVLLMKELSEALHGRQKYLSAAITPGVYAGSIRDGIKPEVYPYVDFFNIMVYDGMGWDSSEPKQHASFKMASFSLDVWLTQKGMPKEKAVLGIPLYGKKEDNTSKAYRELEPLMIDPTLDFAMYGNDLYYFNGTATVKKKALMAKERANGIMFWEFYMDSNNANSLLKAANDAILRNYN